jgi:membrane-bound inhibitor of C-type lysozyme
LKIKIVIIIVLTLFQLIFWGCGSSKNSLKVNKDKEAIYNCGNGFKIKADYYSLSDNSLRFVKIILPGGNEYTLPQVVSGSGARYTDEREMEWWIKGDSAVLKKRADNGDWIDINKNCITNN